MDGDYVLTASRVDQERVGCIRTFSGLYVNPLAMRPEDIRIEDIAHHLSNLCRYTGACPENYNVAQHSVLVSWRLETYGVSRELQLAGLLHDAAEYVFNDLASPVKKDPRMKWYRDLEHETTKMIFRVFGLAPGLLALTKPVDDELFHAEVKTWWGTGGPVVVWSQEKSEQRFLERFHELNISRS